MTWNLSRFRAGMIVEVRSKEEILATLDQLGCLDGMPFMPEMLRYCGRRFRVGAVAHKTCETAHKTFRGRRLNASVHLAGLRCDGSSHGGCQAACNLFWKDSWLRSVGEDAAGAALDAMGRPSRGCSEVDLLTNTLLDPGAEAEEPRYSCQATRLYEATEPLASWSPRQYVRDVISRNHSLGHVLRVLWLAFLKECSLRTPRGTRLLESFRERMHRWLTGREVPEFRGTIERDAPTPTGRLGLRPGDRVRIKTKEEIVQSIDTAGRNRGLYFDVEMSRYCGTVATVRSSVTKIIDELTGKMRQMKQPCIILEGVICSSEYSDHRLMCPRAFPSYWREIWLERVEGDPEARGESGSEEGCARC